MMLFSILIYSYAEGIGFEPMGLSAAALAKLCIKPDSANLPDYLLIKWTMILGIRTFFFFFSFALNANGSADLTSTFCFIFHSTGDRNRTCNLVIKSHLLCLIELHPQVIAFRLTKETTANRLPLVY